MLNPDKDHVFLTLLPNLRALIPKKSQTISICNPPFYSNATEALTRRTNKRHCPNTSNSPIASNEAFFAAGGEFEFICRMVEESAQVPITIGTSLFGLYETKHKLEQYFVTARPDLYFYFDSFQLSHTVRWIVFWSREIDFHSKLLVNCTIPELMAYGAMSADNGLLILAHNTWNRAARRSGAAHANIPALKVRISPIFGRLRLQLIEGNAQAFESFISHLRRKYK